MYNAYLVPHPPLLVDGVGNGGEIPFTRRAYAEIADSIKRESPDTIVLISPHSVMYSDYIHIAPGCIAEGDFGAFGAKQVSIRAEYDDELAGLIGETARNEGIPAGSLGERNPLLDHGVMVPLYFIGTKIKIVRVSLSGLPLVEHYRFGMCLRKAAQALSRRIAVVASGDMSHKLKPDSPYGFAPEGPEFDTFVRECVVNADFLRLMSIEDNLAVNAAECGLRSLVMLAGALDGLNVKSRVLCYEGPFGVGYLTASFAADGRSPSLLPGIFAMQADKLARRRENEDAYVVLARSNVEAFVMRGETVPLSPGLPDEMLSERAGVFVSIKKEGSLRGCIGTIVPTQQSIALEILKNSVAAASKDPRFEPVEPHELSSLSYSVDVLSPAEPIKGPELLDTSLYGVIVTSGYRRGLLLPNLDGIDTVEQQISVALQKAGIGRDEHYTLERFKVVRHL